MPTLLMTIWSAGGLAARSAAGFFGAQPLRLWILIGLLAAALALAGAYRWGAGDARDAQIRAALEAALEAKESWDRTDAETLDLSDVDLCLELGGLREDCELLARKAAPRD